MLALLLNWIMEKISKMTTEYTYTQLITCKRVFKDSDLKEARIVFDNKVVLDREAVKDKGQFDKFFFALHRNGNIGNDKVIKFDMLGEGPLVINLESFKTIQASELPEVPITESSSKGTAQELLWFPTQAVQYD